MKKQYKQPSENDKRYAMVDGDGLILTVIKWDGVSPYPTPFALVLDADNKAAPGGTYSVEGGFAPPATEEEQTDSG